MDISNITSAFMGSIIGILCSGYYDKLKEARKLNRSRKSITAYLRGICYEKLNKYIEDSDAAIRIIEDEVLKGGGIAHTYDMMPMLTSEFFRNIGNDTLERICLNESDFDILLNFYFKIDYLKNTMPYDFVEKFSQWWNKHCIDHPTMSNALIQSKESHFKHCEAVKDKRIFFVGDVNNRIKVAKELLDNLTVFNKKYTDDGTDWILEYLCK